MNNRIGLLAVPAFAVCSCAVVSDPRTEIPEFTQLAVERASGVDPSPLRTTSDDAASSWDEPGLVELTVDPSAAWQQAPGPGTKFIRLRRNMVGFRVAYMSPTDSSLRRLDDDIPVFSLALRKRIGDPASHLSFESGLEYWQVGDSPFPGPGSVELDKFTLPLTFGYNTASFAQWDEGKFNVFVGAGLSLSSVTQRIYPAFGPGFRSTDAGYGFHAQAAIDLPLGHQFYMSGVVRYDYSRLFDNGRLVGNLSDLGGTSVGIEFGTRF